MSLQNITKPYNVPLVVTHFTIGTIYLMITIIFVLLITVNKIIKKCQSNQFTGFYFFIPALFYFILRFLYFYYFIFDAYHQYQYLGLFVYRIGSSCYYTSYLVFLIYWEELRAHRAGFLPKEIKKRMKYQKIGIFMFICSIFIIQFCISSTRIFLNFLQFEEIYILNLIQYFYHFVFNFGIGLLGLILTCTVNRKYLKGEFNELPVKQTNSQILTIIIYTIWVSILIRGLLNIPIGILDFIGIIQSEDISSYLIYLIFPLVFDCFPISFMGFIVFRENNPKGEMDLDDEFISIHGERM